MKKLETMDNKTLMQYAICYLDQRIIAMNTYCADHPDDKIAITTLHNYCRRNSELRDRIATGK